MSVPLWIEDRYECDRVDCLGLSHLNDQTADGLEVAITDRAPAVVSWDRSICGERSMQIEGLCSGPSTLRAGRPLVDGLVRLNQWREKVFLPFCERPPIFLFHLFEKHLEGILARRGGRRAD